MERDFEDFISERINHNYSKLRETKKWQEESKNYNKVYENLYNELEPKQKEKLDKLIETKNALMYFENCFVYKLAFKDIIEIYKI